MEPELDDCEPGGAGGPDRPELDRLMQAAKDGQVEGCSCTTRAICLRIRPRCEKFYESGTISALTSGLWIPMNRKAKKKDEVAAVRQPHG